MYLNNFSGADARPIFAIPMLLDFETTSLTVSSVGMMVVKISRFVHKEPVLAKNLILRLENVLLERP